MVGKAGTVVTRVRGGDRPGEVQVTIRGGTEVWIAYADAEVARGCRVLVVAERPGRCVDVVEYPGADAPLALPVQRDEG